MLLFNSCLRDGNRLDFQFPYIPCYCSTKVTDGLESKMFPVSIHPMLLFNAAVAEKLEDAYMFPYIPCYCSTNVFKPFLSPIIPQTTDFTRLF